VAKIREMGDEAERGGRIREERSVAKLREMSGEAKR
jgi:hypothetical protein